MALLVMVGSLVLVAVTAIATSVPSAVPAGTLTSTLTSPEPPAMSVSEVGCTLLIKLRLSAARI